MTLLTSALKKLASSGLGPQDFKTLRCQAMTGGQVGALGLPAYSALRLPYFDLRGRPTKFFRLRYLEDVPSLNGARKPLRYLQPPGTLSEVYLPPLLKDTTWAQVAKDPETALVITEGELKAACACKRGVPTWGLGGVWMFKSNVRSLPLLPIFEQVTWEGRTVYLCYDSDSATNADVSGAVAALSRELLGLGALPKVITLPALKGLAKTGLDDYLVAKGAKGLAGLTAEAKPFATSAALYELNSEVVYIRDPGLVVELRTGQRLRPKDFTQHAYANRYYHEEKSTKDGTKLVKTPAATAWLGWEQRSELRKLTYRPGQPQVTTERELNLWRGWGCEPRKGTIEPWRELLDFLFQGADAVRHYVEQWLAYPLQKPGTKLFTAVALWGRPQGTGKSMLGYTMKRLYGDNFVEIRDKELADGRNEWAQNKQFVMGDELFSGDSVGSPATKRAMGDRLKGMITQEAIRIDAKYVPSFYVPDCLNYYLNSNHLDMLFVEDQDRRYLVHEVNDAPLAKTFYDDYRDWMLGDVGPSALFHHLLKLDLSGFDPTAPAPMTTAKSLMIEASLSDLGVWVRRLRDDPDSVLRMGQAKLDGDLWTNAELLHVFDPESRTRVSANGLGRELTNAGIPHACRGTPVRTEARGLTRLYAVRRGKEWIGKLPKQAAEHYDRTRGPIRTQPRRKM